jgi:hypothetical protein
MLAGNGGGTTVKTGGNLAARKPKAAYCNTDQRGDDCLVLAALALALLASLLSLSRPSSSNAEGVFRSLLATAALSDDTLVLMDQLQKLGMP